MKEFKDLFPDLETCKKFLEDKLFTDSLFVWTEFYGSLKPMLRAELPHFEKDNWIAPAPTTDEILAELPQCITDKEENEYYLYTHKNTDGGLWCYYVEEESVSALYESNNINPVQALADFYLKLKVEKII